MPDGVYLKYIVRRTDRRDTPGEDHHGCCYFVLDLDCDEHAIPAIEAYAESCKEDHPKAAEDLLDWVESQQPCGCRGLSECSHTPLVPTLWRAREDLVPRSAEESVVVAETEAERDAYHKKKEDEDV